MLLQLAVDRPEGLAVVPQVCDLVDIVEVGTPMLVRFGLSAISTVRELAPNTRVLADTKTVDGGAGQARMVFDAGATFMTVLSSASTSTLDAVAGIADSHGGYIVVDTIGDGGESITERQKFPERCSTVAIHAAYDARLARSDSVQAHLESVQRLHKLGYHVALAGGVDRSSLDAVVLVEPEILVVGRAITCDPNPRETTEWIRARLRSVGHGWPWETR